MNEIKEYTEKVFEDIKHIDDEDNEYWYARELMPLLEYSKYANDISNGVPFAAAQPPSAITSVPLP